MKFYYNTYKIGVLLTLMLLLCAQTSSAQIIFSEPFDEAENSITGVDNTGGVNWNSTCPDCLDANDFLKVQSGELVNQDSNGPAMWETDLIDISSCDFFDISFLLKEEGDLEACDDLGCTAVDYVQLEFNIDNSGWQSPTNSYFCGGDCAGINVIHSDDITGASISYSTGCIEAGNTLQIRISSQTWGGSERWIFDDVEVSCSSGPTVNGGLDQQSCGADVTLTATNPDGATISWNNGVVNAVAFTPPNGVTEYVVYADLAGCIATDTVEVSFNTAPNFTVLGTNPTTCGGTDGFITISGLENSTGYEITYSDGALQGPTTITSNGAGEISLSSLSAGTYTDFDVELNGCSTVDAQNIVLSDPNAPSIDAGTNQFVCTGDDVMLTATNPDGATLTWDNGITNTTTFQATNGNTVYTVTANLSGCISTDFVEITGTNPPTINAGNNQEVCENTLVTLTTPNPDLATISWDNGVTSDVPFTAPVGVNNYILTAELNGCTITDNVSITVNALPNFTITGTNPTTCGGNDGKITVDGLSPNTTYNLTYSNGVVVGPSTETSNNAGQIEISNLLAGTYTNFSVDHMGCSTTIADIINLIDPAIPTVDAGNDVIICLGEEVILVASNPQNGNITWDNGILDGVGFTALIDQIYTVTVEKNNCINSDMVSVSILTAPQLEAGEDVMICIGDTIQLTAQNPNNGNLSWSNDVIDGVSFVPQFTNQYVVTSAIGTCISYDTVEVIVSQGPSAAFTFTPNNPTVENTEVQFTALNANPEIETYSWSFGDNQYSSINSPIHFYPEAGNITYQVDLLVIDNFGCKDSATTFITIDDVLIYYVPNAFTPDDDQINNTFTPVFTSGFDVQDYHLIIFNRWGETIFESYNSQIGWDGTYGGDEIVAEGVYVYSISFGDLKTDERKVVTGTVTLLK
jgi:gliding motility-associated-like protein